MKQVVVAGAGAIGLTTALALAKAGFDVTVRDPAPLGDNASGVAAGMLAPAFESALDPVSHRHFRLLKAARDLWPELAEQAGIALERSGAIYRGRDGKAVAGRLKAAGAAYSVYRSGEVFTQEDWRLRPLAALVALRAAAEAAGVQFEQGPAEPGGLLVVATGAGGRGLAPELDLVRPVKGHILRVHGGPLEGAVLRGDGVYLCPDPAGAVVGATMEPGEAGREVDPAKAASLARAAQALLPEIARLETTPSAGVRAETPDGLPLVGPSAETDVFLAVGARRNGWLLAPLVARTVAAYLRGQDPGPFAAQLDPLRFSREDPPQ